MNKITILLSTLSILAFTAACAPAQPETIIQVETLVQTIEVTRVVEVTKIVEIPVTVTPTLPPAVTDTPTPDYSPTPSLTPSITPTFVVPRGTVTTHAQCRYGPGAADLYKYGLLEGTPMDIIGRNELGTWVYIQAIGGNNPCWINTKLLNVIRGDLMSMPVTYNRLPKSDLYLAPAAVSATRVGNEVTLQWSPVWMTEDDDRGYLIEAWLCQDGQLVFTPIGVKSSVTAIKVTDEPGCFEPSGARVYTAEKHGYTQYRKANWPAFESTPVPTP
jgi:hypothetical protein